MQTVHQEPLRPSAWDAADHSLPEAASHDRAERMVWTSFYIGLGLLFVIGITVGLVHESPAGNEALPPPPSAAR